MRQLKRARLIVGEERPQAPVFRSAGRPGPQRVGAGCVAKGVASSAESWDVRAPAPRLTTFNRAKLSRLAVLYLTQVPLFSMI